MPVVGPNCQGVVVPGVKLQMTFSPMYNQMLEGKVAIVSQSGRWRAHGHQQPDARGVGRAASSARHNEAVLTAADYIHALADKPECRVVLCYIEQIKNGRHFARRRAAAGPHSGSWVVKMGVLSAGVAAQQPYRRHGVGTTASSTEAPPYSGVVRGATARRPSSPWPGQAGRRMRRRGRHPVGTGGLAVELSDLLVRCFYLPPFSRKQNISSAGAEFEAPASIPSTFVAVILTAVAVRKVLSCSRARNLDGFRDHLDFIRNPAFQARQSARTATAPTSPGGLLDRHARQTPRVLRYLTRSGIPIYGDIGRVAPGIAAHTL